MKRKGMAAWWETWKLRLAGSAWFKSRNTGHKKRNSWIDRRQVLCLAAALLLAAAAYAAEQADGLLKEGEYLERPSYGEPAKEVELFVEGLGGEKERLLVEVSPQQYTEEAAKQAFEALMESLPEFICGKNQNLRAVQTNLRLPSTLPAYGGIHLSWYPEDPELVSYEGIVQNLGLKEAVDTSLTLVLTAGELRQEYSIPLRILPPDPNSLAVRRAELEGKVREADGSAIQESRLRLPTVLEGKPLQYRTETSRTPVLILGLGILAAGLLRLKPEEAKRKARKQREQALLAAYPELISKLLIFIGAGLTIRNAWLQIVALYEEALACGQTERCCAYEEMVKTRNELQQGQSEGSAYAAFAHRCGLKCYVRLGALLEQNRKNGEGTLRNLLQLEMQEAFEQQKNAARRQGEEAGTKLMGPLFLSLLAILMMIVVPAMLRLQ